MNYPKHRLWILLEGVVRALDWLGLPALLMFLNQIFKPGTRALTQEEIALAQELFGESIDYTKVRIDETARIACRSRQIAYVGFNVINSWGALHEVHFIHEMVHVWQYQKLGAVYIPRALWAQGSPEAYNYGGIEALSMAQQQKKALLDFNYEQQGDIVADYFCLMNGYKPRWCSGCKEYLPVFQYFIDQLKSSTLP